MPDLNALGYEALDAPIAAPDGVRMNARIYIIGDGERATYLLAPTLILARTLAQLLDEPDEPPAAEPSGGGHVQIDSPGNFQHLLGSIFPDAPNLDAREATRRLRESG